MSPASESELTRRTLLKGSMYGAAALGGLPLLASCTADDAKSNPIGPKPSAAPTAGKTGGHLRIGIVGGGAEDHLDGHNATTHPDQARVFSLYDTLIERDSTFQLRMALAESVTPSVDAKTWTVVLRKGVTFHNGKPLTADDVIFSLKRIVSEKKSQAASLSNIDMGALKKIDDNTVQIVLKKPSVLIAEYLANYNVSIVPVGYDPKNPVGTGAFKFQSFTPGQQSVFVRNENYWRENRPYVDQLTIIDFPEDAARINALISKRVDAIDQVPPAQMRVIEADPSLKVISAETGAWTPFTMHVGKSPYSDVRVRQALRLVVDRQQIIDQVLDGQGRIGNDLYAPDDEVYARDLPQRQQDIDQAKSLLRQAGQSDLRIELTTSSGIAAGVVEAAQVFAKQAEAAGIKVKLNNVKDFYAEGKYLNWPFAQDYWFTRNYLPQVQQGSLPTSPYNECGWKDPKFIELVTQAEVTVDKTKRSELCQEAQKIEYDSGGYIIPAFNNQVDAASAKVGGLVEDKSGIPLGSYRFYDLWLES
jgi:peptide/nickel transport system substrate-binding protein